MEAQGVKMTHQDKLFDRVDICAKAIRDKHGDASIRNGRAWGGPYEISPCPACGKGVLRYMISGPRGHIHANCTETETCGVMWME